MRVSKSVQEEINIIEVIEKLEEKHGTIYWETIDGNTYVFKPCGRKDFNEIMDADYDIVEKEDEFIRKTLLFPEPTYEFTASLKAGVFKRLLDNIMEASHLREEDLKLRVQITNSFRAEMFDMQNQVTCIIHEAFSEYDIEDIENWGIEKTAKFLTRSEWILTNLRGMEINAELAEAAMAGDYNKYKAMMEEEEQIAKKEEKEITPVTKKASLTPDKLQELKAKYPDIDWENDSVAKHGASALNDSFKQSPATDPIGYR